MHHAVVPRESGRIDSAGFIAPPPKDLRGNSSGRPEAALREARAAWALAHCGEGSCARWVEVMSLSEDFAKATRLASGRVERPGPGQVLVVVAFAGGES